MGLRTRKITRGPNKGETTYVTPRSYDLANPVDQRRALRDVADRISFFADPNFYVCDGHVNSRRGPRSPYNIREGSIYEVWPDVFQRAAIEKLRHTPKGKATKKRWRAA